MFVGHDFVVTVRHGQGSQLQSARAFLESQESVLDPRPHRPSSTPSATPSSTATPRSSTSCEIDVDEMEESVFSPARTNDSVRIYTLKREIAEVRRAVMPLRDPMRRFAEALVPGIERGVAPFFRDVLDHLNQTAEIGRDPRQPALDGVRRPPGPGLGPAEQRHAQDLGGHRPGRHAHPGRRRLRHELRPHARARLDARLPVRPAADGVLSSVGLWVFFKKSGWL